MISDLQIKKKNNTDQIGNVAGQKFKVERGKFSNKLN